MSRGRIEVPGLSLPESAGRGRACVREVPKEWARLPGRVDVRDLRRGMDLRHIRMGARIQRTVRTPLARPRTEQAKVGRRAKSAA